VRTRNEPKTNHLLGSPGDEAFERVGSERAWIAASGGTDLIAWPRRAPRSLRAKRGTGTAMGDERGEDSAVVAIEKGPDRRARGAKRVAFEDDGE
jgi:hypothetical protein